MRNSIYDDFIFRKKNEGKINKFFILIFVIVENVHLLQGIHFNMI